MHSTGRRLSVFWRRVVDARSRLPTHIDLAKAGFRFLDIAFKGIGWLIALGVLEYVAEEQHNRVLRIVVLGLGYILGSSCMFYVPSFLAIVSGVNEPKVNLATKRGLLTVCLALSAAWIMIDIFLTVLSFVSQVARMQAK